MDDKNKDLDNVNDDLEYFNKKYSHYVSEEVTEEKSNSSDDFEDIVSYTEGNRDFYSSSEVISDEDAEYYDENDEEEEVLKPASKKGHRAIVISLILVIAILLGCGVWMIIKYVVNPLNNMQSDSNDIEYNDVDESDYLSDEDVNFQAMGDVDGASLNDWLKSWAQNEGDKMYNKNVINVLLCGVDSKDGTATKARSDSMILVSINKKTEKITMVSLLRDSWTYMNVPREDGTTYDYYFKLNSAYNYGGPTFLMRTIEDNFKIEIDQYIAVDFSSFPKLIDALGGVTVEVQEYEAKYIRRTSSQKDFPSGKATLNGKQALIYSRIRHSDGDSDVSRTRRQRTVIKALINSAKTATKGQLLNAFNQVSSYIRTGYTRSEILSLIAQAYSHDWMSFELEELMLPNKDYEDRFSTYINKQSCWVVDYALCAQKLQKALYGETNIFLGEDRVSPLDFVTNKRADYSTNSVSSYTTGYSYSTTKNSEYTSSKYSYSTTQSEEGETSTTKRSGILDKITSSRTSEEPAVYSTTESVEVTEQASEN